MSVDLSAQIPPVQTVQVATDDTADDATQVVLPAWCRAIFVKFFTPASAGVTTIKVDGEWL